MNREELQTLAEDRVLDAQALIAAERWSAAYYLSGYAIECALKSCILAHVARTGVIFESKTFVADCWTHDLEKLLKAAGLEDRRKAERKTNPSFAQNWQIVALWTSISRYQQKTRDAAESLYQAAIESRDGVLPWLRSLW